MLQIIVEKNLIKSDKNTLNYLTLGFEFQLLVKEKKIFYQRNDKEKKNYDRHSQLLSKYNF